MNDNNKETEIILKIIREEELDESVNLVDWNVMYDIIIRQRIFGNMYPKIKKYIPQKNIEKYEKYNEYRELRLRHYIKALMDIVEFSQMHNYKIKVIKGIVLSQIIYDNMFERDFGDIDVIVENDLLGMKHKMNQIGFFHYYILPNNKYLELVEPSNDIRGVFHEYTFCRKEEDVSVKIELKYSASAIGKELLEKITHKEMFVNIENYEVATYDIIHTFLILCLNTYVNSEARIGFERALRLRDYIDLYYYIVNKDIEWEELIALSRKYNVINKIKYVLYGVNYIYDRQVVSQEILNMFDREKSYEDRYYYDRGETIKWKNNLIDRIFMEGDKRLLLYEEGYYNRQHSEKNRNRNDVIICHNIVRKEELKQQSFSVLNCEEDCSVKIFYNIGKTRDKYIFLLRIKKNEFADLRNSFIDINIYLDPVRYGDKSVKTFRTIIDCEHVYLDCEQKVVINDDNVYLDEEYTYIFIEINSYDLDKYVENKTAYNIYVFKKVYTEGNPIIIGIKYHDNDYMVQSADIGLIEFE